MSDLYRRSDARAAPLRIGVLLDSPKLNASFAAVLRDIQASNFAKIELLIFNKAESAKPPARRSLWQNIVARLVNRDLRKRLLYDFYLKLDQRYSPADDPVQQIDCSELLEGIESIEVQPHHKGFVDRFPPDAVSQIEEKHLDVLIRFGFNILRGEILHAARYGIWSYHHGDNGYYRGGPPCLWELVEDNPVSGVILQVLTEQLDGGLVLCKALFPTEKTLFVSRNRRAPYWGSTYLVIWKLNELHSQGWDAVRARAIPSPAYHGRKKIYRTPGNAEMLRWLAPKIAAKCVDRIGRRPRLPHWRLALRSGAEPLFQSAEPSMRGFEWLSEPQGHFWADPCLFKHGDKTWLFFEDYRYAETRGVISFLEVNQNGSAGPSHVALDSGKHLSYPFVFEHRGAVYMVAESAQTNTVPLYRAIRFPYEWVLDRTLLEGHPFVDTTLLYDQERWWMFTTMQDRGGSCAALLLFHADALDGVWKPHPRNPISTDVHNARNGGAFLRHGAKLYRISQDCGRNYGYSFTLNEIIKLTRTEYEECPWRTVDPSWHDGLIATHSYTHAGGIEAADGCFLSLRSRHL